MRPDSQTPAEAFACMCEGQVAKLACSAFCTGQAWLCIFSALLGMERGEPIPASVIIKIFWEPHSASFQPFLGKGCPFLPGLPGIETFLPIEKVCLELDRLEPLPYHWYVTPSSTHWTH